MNMMLKIGLAGITGVFLALLLRKEKGEFAMLIAVAAATLIFGYVLVRVRAITDFLEDLAGRLPIEKTYLTALLKMLGITYIADFAASICSIISSITTNLCDIDLLDKKNKFDNY